MEKPLPADMAQGERFDGIWGWFAICSVHVNIQKSFALTLRQRVWFFVGFPMLVLSENLCRVLNRLYHKSYKKTVCFWFGQTVLFWWAWVRICCVQVGVSLYAGFCRHWTWANQRQTRCIWGVYSRWDFVLPICGLLLRLGFRLFWQ